MVKGRRLDPKTLKPIRTEPKKTYRPGVRTGKLFSVQFPWELVEWLDKHAAFLTQEAQEKAREEVSNFISHIKKRRLDDDADVDSLMAELRELRKKEKRTITRIDVILMALKEYMNREENPWRKFAGPTQKEP